MRSLLGLLVLSTSIPLVLLSFIMFQEVADSQRKAISDGKMQSVLTLSSLVDKEIDTHLALAAGLASSPSLQTGDLEGFRAQALAALFGVVISHASVRTLRGGARGHHCKATRTQEAPACRASTRQIS